MELKKHSKKRIKERVGIPKKAAERNAANALENGLKHTECAGRLKRYFDFLFLSYQKGGKARIHNNHVYIFTIQDTLITVLPLPKEHRDVANKLLAKKKAENGL